MPSITTTTSNWSFRMWTGKFCPILALWQPFWIFGGHFELFCSLFLCYDIKFKYSWLPTCANKAGSKNYNFKLVFHGALRGVWTQLLFRNPNFAFFFTILNINMYPIITNINNSPSANFSCIIWEIKMTIFIIFSSQKTHGRVAGNLARLQATQLRDRRTFVSKALWYRTFKKLDCSLIWNFYRIYHSIHSSNSANFMKK